MSDDHPRQSSIFSSASAMENMDANDTVRIRNHSSQPPPSSAAVEPLSFAAAPTRPPTVFDIFAELSKEKEERSLQHLQQTSSAEDVADEKKAASDIMTEVLVTKMEEGIASSRVVNSEGVQTKEHQNLDSVMATTDTARRAMSPKIETSPSASIRRPDHRRNVSWARDNNNSNATTSLDRPKSISDRQLSNNNNATISLDRPKSISGRQLSDFSAPSSIFQPELANLRGFESTDFERLRGMHNYHDHSRPPTSGHHHRRRLSSLSAADMIRDHLHQQSPMESEAEAYILQAIEQRDPPRPRSESSNPGPTVLSGVPDEAIAIMTTTTSAPPTAAEAATEQSSMMTTSGEGGGGAGENELVSLEGTVRSAPARSKPAPASRPAPITHQKRQQTMEEKLCGLTTELDAIHLQSNSFREPRFHIPSNNNNSNKSNEAGTTVNHRRGRAGTLDSVSDMDDGLLPDPPTDMFQQNTGILYRRMKREESERNLASGHSLGPSGLEAWLKSKSVRKGVSDAHHKKTDDEAADEDDVELQSIQEDDEEMEALSEDKQQPGSGEEGSPSRSDTGDKPRKSHNSLEEWKLARDFHDAVKLMKRPVRLFVKVSLFYVMIPVTVVSAILFYLAGNPPTGVLQNGGLPINGTLYNTAGVEVKPGQASISWWLLFICVRQLITLALALLVDLIVIDFFSVRSGTTYRLLGALPMLFLLQSSGWPFVVFFWCVFDFVLLYGSAPFFQNWLFWQDGIGLFNMMNPSGTVVDSEWYHRILAIAISVAAVVAVKRMFVGIYLGKKTFLQYSDKLATAMSKIILVSQVAYLSRDLERRSRFKSRNEQQRESLMLSKSVLSEDKFGDLLQDAEDGSETASQKGYRSDRSLVWNDEIPSKTTPVIDPDDRHPLTGKLNTAQKSRIVQLLGAWEEPTTAESTVELVNVSSLLHFRRALACLRTDFPFSPSFGPAGTREDTITSSQEVYERLLLGSDDESCLHFHVLALLGVRPDGSLDQDKLVDLIKLFRPDRDGTLSVVDFVKSVDGVYRELRLLRASVNNSTKIDSAFENIFNVGFYGIITVVVLSQLGFDPLALFLSISGVLLGFAFIIGSASSKYFEGVLFILGRRPYEIGDGIHVSDINRQTDIIGSDCWIVKDVTLFSTTVVFSRTKEQAFLSNGALANSRIINASRSPHAMLFCLVKFPIDCPFFKLKIFQESLQTYIRNRPREWLCFTTFRVNRIGTEEGFIEYMFIGQHRECWDKLGTLRDSLGGLMSFTVELSKKLEIAYQKPPMPVNLSLPNSQSNATVGLIPPSTVQIGRNEGASSPRSPAGSMDYSSDLRDYSTDLRDYSTDLRSLHAMFAPSDDHKKYNERRV